MKMSLATIRGRLSFLVFGALVVPTCHIVSEPGLMHGLGFFIAAIIGLLSMPRFIVTLRNELDGVAYACIAIGIAFFCCCMIAVDGFSATHLLVGFITWLLSCVVGGTACVAALVTGARYVARTITAMISILLRALQSPLVPYNGLEPFRVLRYRHDAAYLSGLRAPPKQLAIAFCN